MGTSWTSKTGSSLSYSTSGADVGSTVQTSDYDSSIGAYTSPDPASDGGSAVTVGGEAFAVGDQTLATGDIDLEITDMGTATVATGSATFSGSAQSTDDATAFASADSFASTSPGGKTTTWNITSSESVQTESTTGWSASSTTGILTVYDGAGSQSTEEEPADLTGDTTIEPDGDGDADASGGVLDDDVQPTWDFDNANIALLDIDAGAYGENTFITVDASVLTVEDQLSTVSAVAVGAVG